MVGKCIPPCKILGEQENGEENTEWNRHHERADEPYQAEANDDPEAHERRNAVFDPGQKLGFALRGRVRGQDRDGVHRPEGVGKENEQHLAARPAEKHDAEYGNQRPGDDIDGVQDRRR